MAIADWESVNRNATRKEILQHAILNILHSTSLNSLVIIFIRAIESLLAVVILRRVTIHAERSRQNPLAYHVLKGLTTLLHAMTLKTMTEDLMEEHTTCRTRKNSRTGIRIGKRSITKRKQTIHDVMRLGYKHLLGRKFSLTETKEILIQRALHTIGSKNHGLQHNTDTTAVLHHRRTIRVYNIRPDCPKFNICKTIFEHTALLEHAAHLVEFVLPCQGIYHPWRESSLIV